MLTAAVCMGGDAEGDGEVRYYQGMHDVAAVLLFELGERPAYALLHRLARCQLRDCTRCAERSCCATSPLHGPAAAQGKRSQELPAHAAQLLPLLRHAEHTLFGVCSRSYATHLRRLACPGEAAAAAAAAAYVLFILL